MRTERQREQEQTDSQPDDNRGQQSGGGLYGLNFSPHCGQDTAFEETSRAAARLAVDQLRCWPRAM